MGRNLLCGILTNEIAEKAWKLIEEVEELEELKP